MTMRTVAVVVVVCQGAYTLSTSDTRDATIPRTHIGRATVPGKVSMSGLISPVAVDEQWPMQRRQCLFSGL